MKCRNNKVLGIVENVTRTTLRGCLITLIVLSCVDAAEAAPLPHWKAMNEGVQFDGSWALRKWAWPLNLAEKPFANWPNGFVELSTLISSERQPVSKPEANEKSEQSEQRGVGKNGLLEMLKEHGLYWPMTFLAGLICGGAFGWPLSSRSRHRGTSCLGRTA